MKLSLQKNERQSRASQGRFIFMDAATGPVEVVATLANGAETSIILGRAKAGAEFAVDIRAIEVRNLFDGVNVVEIDTSFARYIPPIEGGAVQFTGQTVPMEVEFDAPPQVSIGAAVEVFTDPGGPLDVKAAPVAAGASAPGGLTPDVSGEAIAANPGRRSIIFRADPANTGLVWLSDTAGNGLPLAAGDGAVTIATTAAVDVVAENATDKIYYTELTA
ncbi:hypothetical protein [Alcanivorax sp.]|uniref:hypothetical protein n=1 Tax=Alcanivorax sp. TaxID=1872427 RepID=UPI0025C22EAD|nr:hypothetical protein [Alcanivorax sp.]